MKIFIIIGIFDPMRHMKKFSCSVMTAIGRIFRLIAFVNVNESGMYERDYETTKFRDGYNGIIKE